MLQVARLAPKQLGESRDLVSAFLRERVNPDGGFQDRAGASDLYYTVFGLDALIALAGRASRRTDRRLPGRIRRWRRSRLRSPRLPGARVGGASPPARQRRSSIACSPASKRAAAMTADTRRRLRRAHGSAYGAFLAMGAYQDLGRAVPAAEGVVTSLRPAARRRRQLRQSSRPDVRSHDRDRGGRARPASPGRSARSGRRHCGCSIAATRAADSLPRVPRPFPISSRRRPRSTPCRRCMCRSPAFAIRASISWTRSGPTAAASSAPGPTTRWTANTPTTRCWRWATSASTRRDGARSRSA